MKLDMETTWAGRDEKEIQPQRLMIGGVRNSVSAFGIARMQQGCPISL